MCANKCMYTNKAISQIRWVAECVHISKFNIYKHSRNTYIHVHVSGMYAYVYVCMLINVCIPIRRDHRYYG